MPDRSPVIAATPQIVPTVIVPVPAGAPFLPRPFVAIDADTLPHRYERQARFETRQPEMLSGNPVSPGTFLSELPSGRIVMQSAAQRFGFHGRRHTSHGSAAQPYAPPSFQIIGEPSNRHMGKPVKLTYGTTLSKRLNPSPRVIWIKGEETQGSANIIRKDR